MHSIFSTTLTDFLLENKLFLLFLVIALGYFLGKVRIKGFSLGVSAVLFVGLAFGSLHPEMVLPDLVYTLGLVLFVYTIGLRSGASFFASFKKSGLRDNLLVLSILVISTILTIFMGKWMGIKSTLMAGLYCGSLTNTPALASVMDLLEQQAATDSGQQAGQLLSEPVAGYSLAYPIGVLGVMILFQLGIRWWRIDMKKEQEATASLTGISAGLLQHRSILVENSGWAGSTIADISNKLELPNVVVSRHLPKGENQVKIPGKDSVVHTGDILTLVGTPGDLDLAEKQLGRPSELDLSQDRRTVDFRRIFISNKAVIGKTIRELELHRRFHAVVTRVRRGDAELPVHDDMQLFAGDRVRVIAPVENLPAIGKFLGDSYEHLSEVDYISISIGICLGLMLGMIPFPIPGGTDFKLGFAAGPLLVALALGKLGRSGRIVWVMSYNANLTLRQIGLVFFLAGIGLKAGYSFFTTLGSAGMQMILVGASITILTTAMAILVARVYFRMPYNLIMGLVAAMQTQPACLAFANEKDRSGAANISYATVFPLAMVAKILLAQLILLF